MLQHMFWPQWVIIRCFYLLPNPFHCYYFINFNVDVFYLFDCLMSCLTCSANERNKTQTIEWETYSRAFSLKTARDNIKMI
jgi:hypothetical protein